jgi:hypothetical protein
MLKVDYSVKVYVGGSVDLPAIFLESGVCTWDNTTGILADKWWGSLTNSVDISYGGNYEAYSPTTVNINASSMVETTLKNSGLSLINSRIEILETSSFGTRIEKRGVITGLPAVGNEVSIQVSHVVNQYSTNLTKRFGGDYAYMVYGDSVNNIPVSVDVGEVYDEGLINDTYYPAFVVLSINKEAMSVRSAYTIDQVSQADLLMYVQGEKLALDGNRAFIAYGTDSVSVVNIAGKEYATMVVGINPLNEKEDSETPYYFAGDVITLYHVDDTLILLPDGATLDNLSFVSDGSKSQFPSYIDYLSQNGNEVAVLDADDSGGLFVSSSMDTRWSGEDEIESMASAWPLTYVSDGVGYYANPAVTVGVKAGTMVDGDLIPWRGAGGVAYGNVYFEAESSSSAGYFTASAVSSYDLGVVKKYDTVYISGNVVLDNIVTVVDNPVHVITVMMNVSVNTILENYFLNISTKSVPLEDWDETFPTGRVPVLSNLFPFDVKDNTQNLNFRWENDSITGKLGREIDILSSLSLTEVELRNPITLVIECSVGGVASSPTSLPHGFDVIENSINVFTDVALKYTDLVADNVTGATGATDIQTAYIDACSRQNLSSLGITAPDEGWGITIPAAGASTAVNTAEILANAPLVELIYKSDETGTKNVKYDLLKYGYGIGYIDSSGLENWRSILDMYNSGGALIEFYDIVGKPSIKDFDSNKIFSDISVNTSTGTINIRNTEQESYDDPYVDGVDDPIEKKALWKSGSVLYRKFNVKNEYPRKLSDCTNITDPITYIKNQYAIAGARSNISGTDVVVTLYKRYTLGVTVSTKFAIENALWIGEKITFSSPHIASLHTGIITGVNRNLDAGNVTITAEMVGGVIATIEEYVIIESGTRDTNIIESGDRETTYVEVI